MLTLQNFSSNAPCLMPKIKQFDEQAVLIKATELFWEKGYFATSIQDLVAHLGINRASLYTTYGNKKTLFIKALNHYQATSRAGIKQLLSTADHVVEGLQKLFDFAIQEALSQQECCKGCFIVNTTTELLPHDEEVRQVVYTNQKEFEKLLEEYLQKGIQQQQISRDNDPRILSQVLFTFINGIRVVSKIEANKNQLDSMIKATLTLIK
jgi:TetR/AcrR family transcriptional repressor of nem operon